MTIELLESLVSVRPHSPLFARLASEYLKRGLSQEARQLCEAGLVHHPYYATAHLVLAKTFFDLGEASAARESLASAMNLVPDSELLAELDAQWSHSVEADVDQHEEYVRPDALLETEALESTELPPQTVDDFDSPEQEQSDQALAAGSLTTTLEARLFRDNPRQADSDRDEAAGLTDVPEEGLHADSAINQKIVESTFVELESGAGISVTELTSDNNVKSGESEEGGMLVHPTSSTNECDERQDFMRTIVPAGEILEVEPPQEIRHTLGKEFDQNNDAPLTSQKLHGAVSNEEGRIVSRTLAEIYARQGAVAEAIITYELLKQVRPEESAEIDQRIKELEQKLQEKAS